MMHFFSRIFRPSPVIVNTYKTKQTDLQRLRYRTHMQLASELGRPFPLRLRMLEEEIVRAVSEDHMTAMLDRALELEGR